MMQATERALSQAGTRIVDGVANFLPGALVFLALLLGSLIVAVMIRYGVLRGLRGIDFDRRADFLGLSLREWTTSRSATELMASAAYWTVLALGLLVGLTALDAALPARFATSVLEYIPDLAAAALILVVGGMLARFLARAVLIGAVNMRIRFARLLSVAIKWLVLVVAAAMALDHIGIGRTVLLLAFAIVFGGVVLAIALAVGLGAKDAVRRALERQVSEPADHDNMDHV